MLVYVVTATSTTDDYKYSGSTVETQNAYSAEDAIARAVEFYLNEVLRTDKFECYDASGFHAIVENNRGNFNKLMGELYEYFSEKSEKMFRGEYVPLTFEVEIKSHLEENRNEVDKDSILKLAFEVRDRALNF